MSDIVFAKSGVIPRTRNKFVEIVTVAGPYFIIAHLKNEESKKQPFRICLPVKLADGRILKKRGKITSHLNLQYCQFIQDGSKNRTF